MWWLAAAQIAAPYIMKAINGNPPAASEVDQVDPGLVKYSNQMMENAKSPNNAAYLKASTMATNAVNSNSARNGLARSSAALVSNQNVQADLANKWQEQAMRNQMEALNGARAVQGDVQGVNRYNAEAARRAAMDEYNQNTQNNKNIFSGISSAANTVGYGYGQNRVQPMNYGNQGVPMDQSIFADNNSWSAPAANYGYGSYPSAQPSYGLGMDYSYPQASGY